MNPDQNNPFANPSTPGAGTTNNPMSGSGLSMADSLASAEDNLTSAGMAANTGPGVMGLDQIASSNPSAVMTPPVEEPLVPAAPVPGSIGSVTSVPLNSADPMNGYDPMMGAGPMAAPEVAPQATSYNPFAQPTTDSMAMSTGNDQANPLPAAQPAPAPQPAAPNFEPAKPVAPKSNSAKSMLNPLSIISLIATVIFLATTILFLFLFLNAKDNPKIVYVPQISDEQADQTLSILSCSFTGENDMRELNLSYTGENLSAISLNYHQNFDSPETAQGMQGAVIEQLSANLTDHFTTNSSIDGSTVNFEAISNDGSLTSYDVARLIYGSEDQSLSTAKGDIQSYLESIGAVCIAQ